MKKLSTVWGCCWPLLAGGLTLAGFHAIGHTYLDSYLLDLGNPALPAPRHMAFLSLWMLFGGLGAALLAVGLVRTMASARVSEKLTGKRDAPADQTWIAVAALFAFLIPLVIRSLVLRDGPLTDDESCYRFSAELLASGRLSVASPPMKLFFDRAFMINDGHLYSQYFLGWPALMVPGVFLSFTGYMNAIYSALTVPALFLVLRHFTTSTWARVGTVLYLLSPFLMIGAATELSHTSCLMALTWLTWFSLRANDEDPPWWSHAGVSLFFGLAFFIRPTAAIGIGLPLIIFWAVGLRRLAGAKLRTALVAFGVPALLMAGLFLWVNYLQNGSPFLSSYQRSLSYAKENDFRFSNWSDADIPEGRIHNFQFDGVVRPLANAGNALLRLNFALFGWPFSLLFIFFAGTRQRVWLNWSCLLCFFIMHFFLTNPGIDSFGPVHYLEACLPLLLLTVLGLKKIQDWLGKLTDSRLKLLPAALVAALLLSNVTGYLPVRLRALARIAESINLPTEAVESLGVHNAVIFTARPFASRCTSYPTMHFVHWRPNNDPDLSNDILWVNHISLETDRRLMEHFPSRTGYVMAWQKGCRLAMRKLDHLEPGSVPDGPVSGTGEEP